MMSAHSRPKLNISRQSRDALEDYACRIYQIPVLEARYRDIVISDAIREFVDDDLGLVTEEKLSELDETLAHSFEGYSRRRSSGGDGDTSDPSDITTFERNDLEQIQPQISERLYEVLSAFVAELNAERSDAEKRISKSAAVDLAIYEYCTNGRTQRNAELATEIRDGHEAVSDSTPATTVDAGTDTESDEDGEPNDGNESTELEDYPYSVDDRLDRVYETVVDELGIDSIGECAGMPRSMVIDAIDQWCTKNPDTEHATDRTREKYIKRICDDLGLVESTKRTTLTEPFGEDTAACDLESYDNLDPEERTEAVRVNLLRAANRRADGNSAQASAADIQDYFEDSSVANGTAHELRDDAIDGEVFVEGNRGGSDGDMVVRVALGRVSDVELLRKAGLSEWAEEIEDSEPESEEQADDEADKDGLRDEATEEMEALMSAQAVTDGGRDKEGVE